MTPAHVARDISRAYRLMYEAGYREVTVPDPPMATEGVSS